MIFSCGEKKIDNDRWTTEITQGMLKEGYTGRGTLYLGGDYIDDKRKYIGEFKDGKISGKGTMWNDGFKYVGEFKDGMRHGKGTWSCDDPIMEANAELNERCRKWKYVGQWKDDYFHGKGTYTHSNGTVEKGLWEKGEFVGE